MTIGKKILAWNQMEQKIFYIWFHETQVRVLTFLETNSLWANLIIALTLNFLFPEAEELSASDNSQDWITDLVRQCIWNNFASYVLTAIEFIIIISWYIYLVPQNTLDIF